MGGQNAFRSSGVTEVVSLGLLNEITTSAFNSCVNLKKVTLNSNQKILNDSCFSGCSSLVNINLHTGITKILGYCFYNCTSLVVDDLNLPNLTTIGNAAFRSTQIKKVSNLGSISTLAGFNNCKQLVSCVIPETVVVISNEVFNECTSLVSVNLPTGITSIGAKAFYNCTSLPLDLNLPNLNSFGVQGNGLSETFSNSAIKKITNLGRVTEIQGYTFYKCSQLESLSLPSTLTILGGNAFGSCTNLSFDASNIPKSVIKIDGSCFNGCKRLYGNIDLPNLQTLGDSAFSGTNIKKVLNLGSITTLGGFTFDQLNTPEANNVFEEAHLPSTLTQIADGAFRSCSKLIRMVFNGTTPPTIPSSTFNDVPATIFVPDGSEQAYKTATNWTKWDYRIKPLSHFNIQGTIVDLSQYVAYNSLVNFDFTNKKVLSVGNYASVISYIIPVISGESYIIKTCVRGNIVFAAAMKNNTQPKVGDTIDTFKPFQEKAYSQNTAVIDEVITIPSGYSYLFVSGLRTTDSNFIRGCELELKKM
jgi:hypothetical protein